MRFVFADTQFFVGRMNPLDHWHAQALDADLSVADAYYLTTESVLTELQPTSASMDPE